MGISGAPSFLCVYRLASHKSKTLVKGAKRAGLYPYQPPTPTKNAEAPGTVRSGALDAIDVERWRLRAAQEEDEEFSPLITLLERGERTLRNSHDRSTSESTLMSVMDYEMVDGLLHRKVRTPEGEMTSVPVIPDGGVKSALVNGKRRMFTWRSDSSCDSQLLGRWSPWGARS